MSSKPGVPDFSVDCIPRGKPWGLGRYGAECLGAGTTLPRAFDHGQIQALQPVEFRFAGKCLSRVCRSVPLEPVRPGGEVGSGGYVVYARACRSVLLALAARQRSRKRRICRLRLGLPFCSLSPCGSAKKSEAADIKPAGFYLLLNWAS